MRCGDAEIGAADALRDGEWQVDLIETATDNFASPEVVGRELESRETRGPLILEQLRTLEPVDGDGGIYFVDGELYVEDDPGLALGGIVLGAKVPSA